MIRWITVFINGCVAYQFTTLSYATCKVFSAFDGQANQRRHGEKKTPKIKFQETEKADQKLKIFSSRNEKTTKICCQTSSLCIHNYRINFSIVYLAVRSHLHFSYTSSDCNVGFFVFNYFQLFAGCMPFFFLFIFSTSSRTVKQKKSEIPFAAHPKCPNILRFEGIESVMWWRKYRGNK